MLRDGGKPVAGHAPADRGCGFRARPDRSGVCCTRRRELCGACIGRCRSCIGSGHSVIAHTTPLDDRPRRSVVRGSRSRKRPGSSSPAVVVGYSTAPSRRRRRGYVKLGPPRARCLGPVVRRSPRAGGRALPARTPTTGPRRDRNHAQGRPDGPARSVSAAAGRRLKSCATARAGTASRFARRTWRRSDRTGSRVSPDRRSAPRLLLPSSPSPPQPQVMRKRREVSEMRICSESVPASGLKCTTAAVALHAAAEAAHALRAAVAGRETAAASFRRPPPSGRYHSRIFPASGGVAVSSSPCLREAS